MRTLFLTLVVTLSCLGADPASYHVSGKIAVGGEGGWDYITADGAARRLYVSHATKTVVVDLDTEKVVGEIADTQGVHGIAIAPKLGRGFTSNGRTNDVTVFDLKTLAPLSRVATGQNPDAIIYDPASDKVFTFNGRSKDSTVFEAATGKVVATIPLGGKPEFSAVDGKGKLWVNNEDTAELIEIDTAKLSVTRKVKLEGCEEPSGLAIDVKNTLLFSVCGNKVAMVTDGKAGKVLATVPIGSGCDGVAFDPGPGYAFASNGQGTITVIGKLNGKYAALATATSQQGARTITVDPTTHKLYLPTAQFGPAPAPAQPGQRVRPPMIPGSFTVLVVAP